MLDFFKQSQISQTVNVDIPSRLETVALKFLELGPLGFSLVTFTEGDVGDLLVVVCHCMQVLECKWGVGLNERGTEDL